MSINYLIMLKIMYLFRVIVIIITVAQLFGCSSFQTRKKDAPLDADWSIISGKELIEGETAAVDLRLENTSTDILILKDIQDNEKIFYEWQVSRPGEVIFKTGLHYYTHDVKNTAKRTKPIFNKGFLAPGETALVILPLRLIKLPRNLIINFIQMPVPKAAQLVYFPRPTKDEHIWEYQKITEQSFSEYAKKRVHSEFKTIFNKDIFIVPIAEVSVNENIILKKHVDINAEIRMRSFGLSEATDQLGRRVLDHSYSIRLGGWIMQTGINEFWLVRNQDAWKMPLIDFEPMAFIDRMELTEFDFECHNEIQELFETKYKIIMVENSKGKRMPRLMVPSDKLEQFFKELSTYENIRIAMQNVTIIVYKMK